MDKKKKENLSASRFLDTIYRTIFIMIVAIVFTRVLELPLWTTVAAIGGGFIVIVHAFYWIKKLEKEKN